MTLLFRQLLRPTLKVTVCNIPKVNPFFHKSIYRPKKTLTPQFQLTQNKAASQDSKEAEIELAKKKATKELENTALNKKPADVFPVGVPLDINLRECLEKSLEESRKADMGYY
jgi:hypothetical protein